MPDEPRETTAVARLRKSLDRMEDATFLLLLREILRDDDPEDMEDLPELNAEERRAMEALGPDLIHRLLSEGRTSA